MAARSDYTSDVTGNESAAAHVNITQGFTEAERSQAATLMEVYTAAICVIAISIICANVLVLMAMYKYTPLQTVTNRFVVSLSLADLLTGSCIIISVAISRNNTLLADTTVCAMRAVLPQTALQVSLFNLLGIAIDRYIAVMYPLHYTSVMIGRRANQIIVAMWLYAVSLVVIPMIFTHNAVNVTGCYVEFFLNKYHLFAVFLHYWIGAITMIFIYSCIFRTTSAHIRRLERQYSSYVRYRQQSSTGSSNGKSKQNTTGSTASSAAPNSPHISQTVKVFSMVFGTFFLGLTPYYTMYMVVAFNWTPDEMIRDFNWSFIWLPLADVLIALNSTINPYIYAWKYTDFRIAFKNLLCCRSQHHYNMDRHSFIYADSQHRASIPAEQGSLKKETTDTLVNGLQQEEQDVQQQNGNQNGNTNNSLPPLDTCCTERGLKTAENGNSYALINMTNGGER